MVSRAQLTLQCFSLESLSYLPNTYFKYTVVKEAFEKVLIPLVQFLDLPVLSCAEWMAR